jgi:hypothetical protein
LAYSMPVSSFLISELGMVAVVFVWFPPDKGQS